MNEENISNVMSYIQQYPDQSTETLVQSLITAGYPLGDIKIALGRLGLSPLALPGYTPQIARATAQNTGLLPGKNLIAVAGATIILIGIYYMGNTNLAKLLSNIPFLGRKPQLSHPAEPTTTPLKENSTKKITQENPITPFRVLFEKNTYKINISMEQTNPVQNNIELIYYTENGFIDRHDNMAGKTFIVRTNAFYTIDHTKKTFSKVDSTDFRYGVLAQSLQDSFIIKEVLAGETAKFISWELLSQNQWKGVNKESKSYFIFTTNNMGLPTSMELYDDKGEKMHTFIFTFEPMTITEDLLTVPTGYREIEQIDL